jgi:hypothetical protein
MTAPKTGATSVGCGNRCLSRRSHQKRPVDEALLGKLIVEKLVSASKSRMLTATRPAPPHYVAAERPRRMAAVPREAKIAAEIAAEHSVATSQWLSRVGCPNVAQ